MKQKYLTIPLAIGYWFIPLAVDLSSDGFGGFAIFGILLSIGALSDLGR